MPTLQELETLCAIVNNGFSISAAANRLRRSQPTLSRQVQQVERELGAQVFTRTRNRVVGLTSIGREIIRVSQRIVREAETLPRIASGEALNGTAELKIATTHLSARYSLPRVMKDFATRLPGVMLTLHQGHFMQCCQLVAAGEADMSINTLIGEINDEFVAIPAYRLHRCVVVRRDHPLARDKTLTLKKVAQYPIVAYSSPFSGRAIMDDAFARAGLTPRVVCTAIDADVCKKYVEVGMGIAVLADIAVSRQDDPALVAMKADHLFRPAIMNVILRKFGYLSRHAREFISLYAPHIDAALIQRAIDGAPIDRARLSREAPVFPQ